MQHVRMLSVDSILFRLCGSCTQSFLHRVNGGMDQFLSTSKENDADALLLCQLNKSPHPSVVVLSEHGKKVQGL